MKKWLKAFRLRTLPLSLSTVLTGSALAYIPCQNDCLGTSHFNWLIFTLTITTTLFLQILSNLANDYGDAKKGADNEGRIGPERSIQSGEISASQMLSAIIVFAILSLLSGLLLLFIAFEDIFSIKFVLLFVVGLMSIAAAIKYTVGKGAYGYRALGDLFVFIFFGLVGVAGAYFLQVKNGIPLMIWSFAASIGFLCTAVLNLNNMRDRINDAKVGKRTLAVILGFRGAKIYHYLLFAAFYCTFLLPLLLQNETVFIELLIIAAPMLLLHGIHLLKVSRVKEPKAFDPELKKVAISSLLFSILLWITVFMV